MSRLADLFREQARVATEIAAELDGAALGGDQACQPEAQARLPLPPKQTRDRSGGRGHDAREGATRTAPVKRRKPGSGTIERYRDGYRARLPDEARTVLYEGRSGSGLCGEHAVPVSPELRGAWKDAPGAEAERAADAHGAAAPGDDGGANTSASRALLEGWRAVNHCRPPATGRQGPAPSRVRTGRTWASQAC